MRAIDARREASGDGCDGGEIPGRVGPDGVPSIALAVTNVGSPPDIGRIVGVTSAAPISGIGVTSSTGVTSGVPSRPASTLWSDIVRINQSITKREGEGGETVE